MDVGFNFRAWCDDKKCFLRVNGSLPMLYTCLKDDGIESYVIEQCTGLKDKNGNLVYENDILKCDYSDIMKYQIYWGNNGFRMKVYGTDNRLVDDCGLFNDLSIMEVIGNIHENRGLIENADFK